MLFLFLPITAASQLQTYPTYQDLVLQNASVNYNKLSSPYDVYHAPITLRINAPFVVMTNVVEAQQMVSYIVNIEYTWIDRRLQFDADQLGMNFTLVPSSSIWIPTVDCFNCIDVHRFDMETFANEAAVVPNGRVFIDMKAKVDTICSMDIEAFPFDTQFCGMDFHNGFATDGRMLLSVPDIVMPVTLLGTPEWSIEADYSSRMSNETFSKDVSNSIVSIRFRLIRNTTFYVVMLITPTLLVASVTLAALTLPLDISKGDKYMVGISGLLGLTFLLGIIIQQVPRSAKMPVMSFWLLMEMAFCVLPLIIDEPVRAFKRFAATKRRCWDDSIDYLLCLLIVGLNLSATCLLFILYPKTSANPAPIL